MGGELQERRGSADGPAGQAGAATRIPVSFRDRVYGTGSPAGSVYGTDRLAGVATRSPVPVRRDRAYGTGSPAESVYGADSPTPLLPGLEGDLWGG